MLGNTKGKQLYNYTPDYVLFDLETTGISRNTDEVIEISAVKVRNGRVVDEFSHLVNPGKSIPYAASMVNNITNQMVRNAPHFDRVVDAYMKENTTELVDPLDVKKKVDMLEEKRNILLTELDTQIKVSNATTFIEIA